MVLSIAVLYQDLSLNNIECEGRHHVPMMAYNFAATRKSSGSMISLFATDVSSETLGSIPRPRQNSGICDRAHELGVLRLRPILLIGDRRPALSDLIRLRTSPMCAIS